jgi:hypothetical protein
MLHQSRQLLDDYFINTSLQRRVVAIAVTELLEQFTKSQRKPLERFTSRSERAATALKCGVNETSNRSRFLIVGLAREAYVETAK